MIPFRIDLFSYSGAALLGSHIAQSGMLVFRVIPVDKGGKPGSGVLKGGKTIRISNGIFQGFIPGFNKGIVIADPRPGIASGYVKAIKKDSKGNASHRMSIISMYKLWNHLMTSDNPAKQVLGTLIRLLRFYGPTYNRTVIDIDDDIGVIKYPVYRCFKPGDIPSPDLIRSGYLNGLSPSLGYWLFRLPAMDYGFSRTKDSVERTGTAMIYPLICKQGNDLFRCFICKAEGIGYLIKGLYFRFA